MKYLSELEIQHITGGQDTQGVGAFFPQEPEEGSSQLEGSRNIFSRDPFTAFRTEEAIPRFKRIIVK